MAVAVDTPGEAGHEQRLEQAEADIDNLRAAFAWSREKSHTELALQLPSALQPLWLTRGRIQEGLTWFDAALSDENAHHLEVAPVVRARALADKATLDAWVGATSSTDQAEQALEIARELDDSALLARALTARGCIAYNAADARPYFAEAIGLARALGDAWRLSQIHGWQAWAAMLAGDSIATRAAAEEGPEVATAIGDRFSARTCRTWLGWALMMTGDLVTAAPQFSELAAEAEAAHDLLWWVLDLISNGQVLAYQGATSAARAAVDTAIEAAAELGGIYGGAAYGVSAVASLAAGDVIAAQAASEAAGSK